MTISIWQIIVVAALLVLLWRSLRRKGVLSADVAKGITNFRRYTGSGDIQKMVKGVQQIVSDYGAFLEHQDSTYGVAIFDEKDLPHKKEVILDAICLVIRTELDDDMRNALKISATRLAEYQEGVGDQPVSMQADGLDMNVLSGSLSTEEMKDLAAKMARTDQKRFEYYKSLADKDLNRIMEKLQEAEQMRMNTTKE